MFTVNIHTHMHLLRHEINSNELIIPHSHSQANSFTIHKKDSVPSYKEHCRLFRGASNWTHMLNERERKKLNHLYEGSNILFQECSLRL